MTSEAAVMSKPVSRGEPLVAPPRPVMMLPQAAVVHVDAAPPRDRVRIDVELVAVHHVRVEERREQVVGGRDRVHVAGEVEVEILHRHDLRVAGAGRAALDAEDRAERGLADAQERLLADRAHALRERDRRRRLALAGLGRRDRRDADDLAVRLVLQPVEHREADLRLVAAVGLDLGVLEAGGRRDLLDRAELGLLCDLETALHARRTPVRGVQWEAACGHRAAPEDTRARRARRDGRCETCSGGGQGERGAAVRRGRAAGGDRPPDPRVPHGARHDRRRAGPPERPLAGRHLEDRARPDAALAGQPERDRRRPRRARDGALPQARGAARRLLRRGGQGPRDRAPRHARRPPLRAARPHASAGAWRSSPTSSR